MNLLINDMEFRLSWKYNREQNPPITTCNMVNLATSRTAQSNIVLYYKDAFCYKKARKYSLSKLMKNDNLNKETRTIIWKTLLEKNLI